MAHYDTLTPAERISVLEDLATFLPSEEAEAAKQTAFIISKSEDHQLRFKEMVCKEGK